MVAASSLQFDLSVVFGCRPRHPCVNHLTTINPHATAIVGLERDAIVACDRGAQVARPSHRHRRMAPHRVGWLIGRVVVELFFHACARCALQLSIVKVFGLQSVGKETLVDGLIAVGHRYPWCMIDLDPTAHACLDALKHRHRVVDRCATIVAKLAPCRVESHDTNRPDLPLVERQHVALVLEQHQALPCRLQRQLLVLLAAHHIGADAVIGVHGRVVKEPQAHAPAQDVIGRRVDVGIGDAIVPVGVKQWLAIHVVSALQVQSRLDGQHSRGLIVPHILVLGHHPLRCAAVAHHISIKSPVMAQHLLQQIAVDRAGDVVHRIVSAHHALRLALLDTVLKGRQIILAQVTLADDSIAAGTVVLLVVGSKVLECRHHLDISWVIALQPTHKGASQSAGEHWVLAIGLGCASPSRVTRHVDGWRPEGEQVTAAVVLVTSQVEVVPLATRLIADGGCDALQQGRVPCCRQRDGLRKHGELARPDDAMQRLVAVIILVDAQARNGLGIVGHDGDFLLDGHATQQVHDALVHGCIHVAIALIALCRLCIASHGDGSSSEYGQ